MTKTFVATAVIDDVVLAEYFSVLPLARIIAWLAKEYHGVPQLWCGVRRGGVLIAELHTNFRGEWDEGAIHSPISSLVTAINPCWLNRKAGE
jgi:hypothetical protein